MSNRKAKTTAKQVKQTVPAETPETVEEQAVQAESETAAEAAAQPGRSCGDPGKILPPSPLSAPKSWFRLPGG